MGNLKKKEQIIDETINFYNLTNRGEGLQSCMYYVDGKMCAVGRCLIDAKAAQHVTSSATILLKDRDDLLKPEYRGHEVQFWSMLQHLHDNHNNFTETGMSEIGLQEANNIKQFWKA